MVRNFPTVCILLSHCIDQDESLCANSCCVSIEALCPDSCSLFRPMELPLQVSTMGRGSKAAESPCLWLNTRTKQPPAYTHVQDPYQPTKPLLQHDLCARHQTAYINILSVCMKYVSMLFKMNFCSCSYAMKFKCGYSVVNITQATFLVQDVPHLSE